MRQLAEGAVFSLLECPLALRSSSFVGNHGNNSHVRKERTGATPIQGNGRERGRGKVLHYEALLARKVSSELFFAAFKRRLHAYCRRYKRVFCVGSKGITTLNPGTGEVTNQVRVAAEGEVRNIAR